MSIYTPTHKCIFKPYNHCNVLQFIETKDLYSSFYRIALRIAPTMINDSEWEIGKYSAALTNQGPSRHVDDQHQSSKAEAKLQNGD